jgi:hypothetical protein
MTVEAKDYTVACATKSTGGCMWLQIRSCGCAWPPRRRAGFETPLRDSLRQGSDLH